MFQVTSVGLKYKAILSLSGFKFIMRPLHDRGAKEKCAKILLIEAGNEVNIWILTSLLTKSSEILVIFTCDSIVQRSHYK